MLAKCAISWTYKYYDPMTKGLSIKVFAKQVERTDSKLYAWSLI